MVLEVPPHQIGGPFPAHLAGKDADSFELTVQLPYESFDGIGRSEAPPALTRRVQVGQGLLVAVSVASPLRGALVRGAAEELVPLVFHHGFDKALECVGDAFLEEAPDLLLTHAVSGVIAKHGRALRFG